VSHAFSVAGSIPETTPTPPSTQTCILRNRLSSESINGNHTNPHVIIVLRSGVHGDLYFRKVGSFVADSLEHAEDLHERVFENSVPYARTDEEAPLLWSEFEFRSAIGLGRVSVEQAERTLNR
jgi:hypothetical protein